VVGDVGLRRLGSSKSAISRSPLLIRAFILGILDELGEPKSLLIELVLKVFPLN